jgi:toxin-antitoxin system PIN domain toxin
LVYAHRPVAKGHDRYRAWLEELTNGQAAFGLADLALGGFVRIVTHPRVFRDPTPCDLAIAVAEALRRLPNCVSLAPGPRHWDIFTKLCLAANVRGNLVPDAYLAALAIESGSELITDDRGFGRYPGLRWHGPFDWDPVPRFCAARAMVAKLSGSQRLCAVR